MIKLIDQQIQHYQEQNGKYKSNYSKTWIIYLVSVTSNQQQIKRYRRH